MMCPTGNAKKEDDNEYVEQLEDDNKVWLRPFPSTITVVLEQRDLLMHAMI
jgi:Oxysterol-binding protein